MGTVLTDSYQRRIEYVRLSVTDRCELRCTYCLPRGFRDFGDSDDWLSFDEIERVMRAFTELGVRRIRITGGEPLSRGRIPELAARLHALPGLEDLSLSTNATRLAKLAGPLKTAGISRVNVSLDSLRADRFAEITGGGDLGRVLDGLTAAQDAGLLPVKINMVALGGVNDDEFEDMVAFCLEHGFTLRFIELMPVGDTARAVAGSYLDLREVRRRLELKFDLLPATMPGGGPARYVQVAGTDLRIGFITPISQHFCATCNRVRLSADGTLYTCLGQEHAVPLRALLRGGASDDDLQNVIQRAIRNKPERHEFTSQPGKIVRFMSATGG